MNLLHLKYFKTAAELEHITKAADKLLYHSHLFLNLFINSKKKSEYLYSIGKAKESD